MSPLVPVGRVGRPHGWDGSFWVEGAGHGLPEGTRVTVGARDARVERRGGTDARPLLRVSGVADRDAASAVRGEPLLMAEAEAPLAEGEWLIGDLVGCEVPGLGTVRRVIGAPSCDLLEVGDDAVLVPLVADAIRRVDTEARVIEVDREFLAL
ncbi:MAG: hypothetical protein WD844_16995 [Thermoleophilaceae bacterium]